MPEHDDGVNDEPFVHRKVEPARDAALSRREQRLEKYGDWEDAPPKHLVEAEEEKREAERKLYEAEIDKTQARERKERVERSQFVTQKSEKGAAPHMTTRDLVIVAGVGLVLAVIVGLLAKEWWLGPLWGAAVAAGIFAARSDRRRREAFEATIMELGDANDLLQANNDVLFERGLELKKKNAVYEQMSDFQMSMNTVGVEVVLGGIQPFGGPQTSAKLRMPANQLHKHLVDAAMEAYEDATRHAKFPQPDKEEQENIRTDYEERFWDWIKDMERGKR